MENQTKMGMNRTGMQMSPIEGPNQVQYALDQPPNPTEGSAQELATLRADYIRGSTRAGSVALPGTGKGLLQVITDPRTTVAQSLEATLTAELSDNACWELLTELASECGHDEMVEPFQKAMASEAEHVVMIKQWLRETVLAEAT